MTPNPDWSRPLHPSFAAKIAGLDADGARKYALHIKAAAARSILAFPDVRLAQAAWTGAMNVALHCDLHADALDPNACAVINEANAIVAAALGAEGIEP